MDRASWNLSDSSSSDHSCARRYAPRPNLSPPVQPARSEGVVLAVAESEDSSSPAAGGVEGREGMRSARSNLAWNVARGALLPPARLPLPAPRELVPYDETLPTLPPPCREGATEVYREASMDGASMLGAEAVCSGVLVPCSSFAVSSSLAACFPLCDKVPLASLDVEAFLCTSLPRAFCIARRRGSVLAVIRDGGGLVSSSGVAHPEGATEPAALGLRLESPDLLADFLPFLSLRVR